MISDDVVKSSPCGVTAFFQDFDIHRYAFTPEKPPSLAGQNIYLAIFFFVVGILLI